MNGKASISQNQDSLLIAGQLDFDTVVSLWNDSLPLIKNRQKLDFNFSQVSSADSAALALLIEWLKYAKRENKSISFQDIPAQLMAIASVADIADLLKAHG